MKRSCVVCLFLCVTATLSFSQLFSQSNPVPSVNVPATGTTAAVVPPVGVSHPAPQAQARILDGYGKLPLSFEPNLGQSDAQVKFLSRTGAYTLFLTGDEAVLALRGKKLRRNSPQELKPASFAGSSPSAKIVPFTKTSPRGSSGDNEAVAETLNAGVLRMKLRNANLAAKVTGEDELPGLSNYFLGNDPAKWRTLVATYAKVKYEGIYSGIDLVYYGNQRQLEYDFIVAPGADPHRIAFDLRGAKKIRQNARGDLILNTGEGEIRWHKPVVYQEKNGTRQLVGARYAITDNNRVGFELAKYDASRPLYIDPLIYSTYLGGSMQDYGYSIAVDSAGYAYVTGVTQSTDFPTMNPLQGALRSTYENAFVSKFGPDGSKLVYSTYLGGMGDDQGFGIAADSAGNAYVTGFTSSLDFPTMNPLQPSLNGGVNAFVSKITATGSSLVYSTYLGGSGLDWARAIAVDSGGNAYVSGQANSTDFPTVNPLQPSYGGGLSDAFVSVINSAGTALLYSTYLGGSGFDGSLGIAVDSAGSAYITGLTESNDFPTTPGAFQTVCNTGSKCATNGNAFVSKIDSSGALAYSTYLGGSGGEPCPQPPYCSADGGIGIAVDGGGNAYVAGATNSLDFPTTTGAFQTRNAGGFDAFVSKLNPTGTGLVYSTFLGSGGLDWGSGIALDGAGNAYVTGYTRSTTFPRKNPLQSAKIGVEDAFVSKLNPSGSALVYSTYLGGYAQGYGIAVDGMGSAYVTGNAGPTGFPTTPGTFQTKGGGGADAFVTKILYFSTSTQLISSANPSISGHRVTFTATVSSPSGGTPTGHIILQDGAIFLARLRLSGGTAHFNDTKLPPGLNSITAVYGGDANFDASSSPTLNQFVLTATTTALTSSPNPSTEGQAVTFTAVVTSSVGAPPDGEEVTFMRFAKVLGMGTLSGGTASFTTSTLPSGTTGIQAVYAGDSTFGGSASKVLKQGVN
jgi:hypothetical protein